MHGLKIQYLKHFNEVDLSRFKMEGKGKHSRHFKIYSLNELDEKLITTTLKEIAAIARTKN